VRYMVRQRMFSIGDDFWITDEQGDRAYLADGKAMSLRQTLELKDPSGTVVASVHKKLLALRDAMEIKRDGRVIATVRREMFSPLHHKSSVDLADGRTLEAVGNLTGREFDVRDGGQTVARVSRSWFTVRDTYGVDVAPGEDDALMLAVAVCLDRIHHEEDRH
jgi:uncharacterized protein YxjI